MLKKLNIGEPWYNFPIYELAKQEGYISNFNKILIIEVPKWAWCTSANDKLYTHNLDQEFWV